MIIDATSGAAGWVSAFEPNLAFAIGEQAYNSSPGFRKLGSGLVQPALSGMRGRTPHEASSLGHESDVPTLPRKRVFVKIRDVMKLLERDGWQLVRQRGSHRQYRHDRKAGLVTVAGKPNADLAPGTLNSIFKQARLKP